MRRILLVTVTLALFAPAFAFGAIFTAGEQDFTDGQFVSSGAFLGASSNEPAPFMDFNGSGDVAGPNFTAMWTFTFPLGTVFVTPTITIGILDHDSMASGSQIAFFGFDGNNLTTQMNAAFESKGGANGQYNTYSIAIPVTAVPSLADGSATFTLTLQGPGLSVVGESTFNGAGLDFAQINTVPEAQTWMLLGFGSVVLWAVRISRGRAARADG
ncbi:MAG TPA: hypothetical protein VF511_04550 [Chthoniobacterales bacterium]